MSNLTLFSKNGSFPCLVLILGNFFFSFSEENELWKQSWITFKSCCEKQRYHTYLKTFENIHMHPRDNFKIAEYQH